MVDIFADFTPKKIHTEKVKKNNQGIIIELKKTTEKPLNPKPRPAQK